MAERRKLGRGLSTLIPTAPPTADAPSSTPTTPATPAPPVAPPAAHLPASALRDVAIDAIVANPHQPRVHFEEDSLADLAKSIKEIGVLQPLLVRESSPGSYVLIAGERRWRAAKKANLKQVPVVVREITEIESVISPRRTMAMASPRGSRRSFRSSVSSGSASAWVNPVATKIVARSSETELESARLSNKTLYCAAINPVSSRSSR